MRRIVAILNPNADRGRTAALADEMRRALGGRLDVTLMKTTCRGEAVELAREAATQGCEAVVAIGGDGTVHETVNGLMDVPLEVRPALGIVPAGSGNDVAYALGIDKDLRRTLDFIERGETRAVDVGEVRTASGRSCRSINNVGLLLEGQINLLSHQLAWPRGSGLYFRAMLQTLMRRPPVAHLDLDCDGVRLQREAILLSIGNGPRSGGRFHLVPAASMSDGKFNYLLAEPMSRLRMLWEVRRSLSGKPMRDPRLQWGTFSHLTIRSDIALVAHVDGEPWLRPEERVRELTVDVLAGALQVLCPAVAPE